MKRFILLVLAGLMLINMNQKNKTAEDEMTVAWLRNPDNGMSNASVQTGSFFVTQRNTVYGADCKGCTIENGISSTSAQIEMTKEAVRQSDGTWKSGITYDGYYLIAADPLIPLCTVVQISRHSYSGEGIEENESFLAIVVDRGGLIQGKSIDLYAGSENNPKVIHKESSGAIVTIIGFLQHRNEDGRMICAGP